MGNMAGGYQSQQPDLGSLFKWLGKTVATTGGSMAVGKGMNQLFGPDVENVASSQVDPAAGHAQAQSQLLQAIMRQMQQGQMNQPQQQHTTSMDINQFLQMLGRR